MKQRNKSIKNIENHGDWSEKMIEAFLCNEVRRRGGIPLKYSNPNNVGYPDRVLLLPGGTTIWVEVKSKGQKPRLLQQQRIERMTALGHNVVTVDCKEDVITLLSKYPLSDKYEI